MIEYLFNAWLVEVVLVDIPMELLCFYLQTTMGWNQEQLRWLKIKILAAVTILSVGVLFVLILDWLEMQSIKFRAMQLWRGVIQVYAAHKSIMIKVLNKSNKDAEHKDRHADFSNLPTLVLWMVKDRLDFPNNLRFASVCKGWREAELSYSKDIKLCGESPPWIMIKDAKGSGRCEFISMSTGERYSIYHPDLCHGERYIIYRPDLRHTKTTKTLFTKQGWLFLHTKFRTYTVYDLRGAEANILDRDDSLFLLNPFTNKKIELPGGVSLLRRECSGAFTLEDGKPDLVVFAGVSLYQEHVAYKGPCIRLWTVRVADHHNNLWNVHTFKSPPWVSIKRVIIIGQNIYIVNETSAFLVFNLPSCKWVTGQQLSDPTSFNIVETGGGEVWKVDSPPTGIYKLNDNCTEWEKLRVNELKYKCWFQNSLSYCYAVSKDIDDAIYHYLKESGHLKRLVLPYYHEDDANTVSEVILYITRGTYVECVDMP